MSGKPKEASRKVALREQRRKQEQRNRIILISVISVVAVALAVLLIVSNQPASADRITKPEMFTRPQIDGQAVGDPNAPIKIEEYSDFKCIHCRDFWERSEKRLIEEYVATGKVYFKYVPLSFISPESYRAAEAAYCALDQGKFWEYHDYVFANFGAELNDAMLKGIARQLNLDTAAFDRCYNSRQYQQRVLDDARYASGLGVTGTPTFNVNGQLVGQGELFDTIEQELAKLNPADQ